MTQLTLLSCQCIILSLNILYNMLEKIMKVWYFENTYRDESNDIIYNIIYLCILVEKYGQCKLGQNCNFQIGHLLRDGGSNSSIDTALQIN
jgi:hypothetical protein